MHTEITGSDIVRSSAQAVPQEEGYASVTFTFTPTGSSKFCRLTRALARRGAAARKRQRFAVAINGRERRPFTDYEATPDGLCGNPGVQLEGMPLAEALELAELIRGGSTR